MEKTDSRNFVWGMGNENGVYSEMRLLAMFGVLFCLSLWVMAFLSLFPSLSSFMALISPFPQMTGELEGDLYAEGWTMMILASGISGVVFFIFSKKRKFLGFQILLLLSLINSFLSILLITFLPFSPELGEYVKFVFYGLFSVFFLLTFWKEHHCNTTNPAA